MSAARPRTPRRTSAPRPGAPDDVLVVGGGIVGLTVAWRALDAGLAVTLLDPAGLRGSAGAVHAAAGMLAAVSEAEHGEHALARVNLASAALWPGLARALQDASGVDVGLAATGTLAVAYDAADARRCRDLLALQRSWGLDVHEVTPAEARERVPLLGPHVSAATWAPGERQVDPRAVLAALRTVLTRRTGPGVDPADGRLRVVEAAAAGLVRGRGGEVVGLRDDRGDVHPAGLVVLAAGAGSALVVRDEPDLAVPVRPVLGTTLRLDARGVPGFRGLPVVRGTVQHRAVYVVPRPTGEVVVGATSDEREPADGTRAGDVFALLRDARALLPGLDELPLVDVTTRARPATPDHVPLVGPAAVPGLVLATGHHRNGVLQTPLTAAVLDALLAGEPLPEAVRACDPRRFAARAAGVLPSAGALPEAVRVRDARGLAARAGSDVPAAGPLPDAVPVPAPVPAPVSARGPA
ncbi:FAD-dependent oxidoreductase [Cellulomonas cellasea]|uniref:Thiamine biosynthesis oxidoreductase ThiO n=2 Tax=Cellulomonas cellasea TaxID=43670 RepID=A0A4Y3KQK8_9CELL|nr:FAD-dependent oxidoreductase [Cellulomonas cellasea]GEA86217.1 putative thiamine biosynthesis oxidoreductase ThiO [Cellulomonas cellasea]